MADLSKAVPLIGAKNIRVALPKPNIVALFVDLSKDLGPSSTGKTTMVASSSGSRPLGGSGAVLGLNIFTKGPKTNLKALAELVGKKQVAGTGLEWQVLAPHTLELLMTIGTSGKVSGSGKTSVVATSSGNKPIGKSGITFGLNCYTKVGASVKLDRLAALVSTAASEIADGVMADHADPKWSVVTVDLTKLTVNKLLTFNTAAPPDVTVAVIITLQSAVQAAKGDDDDDEGGGAEDPFETAAEALNLQCTSGNGGIFALRFDRTLRFDGSTSGKSISVASTRGSKTFGSVKLQLNAYAANPNAPPKAATPAAAAPPSPPTVAALVFAVEKFLATVSDEALGAVKMSEVRAAVKAQLEVEELEDAAKDVVRAAIAERVSQRLKGAVKAEVKSEETGEKSPKKARTEA